MGQDYPPHGLDATLAQLLDWYLKSFSMKDKTVGACLEDMESVDRINEYFGDLYIDEVIARSIGDYLHSKLEMGFKYSDIRRQLDLLKDAYRLGIKHCGLPIISPFND